MNSNSEMITIDNVSVPTPGVTLGCTAPALSTGVTNITCDGPNSGAINLEVGGGTPGYSYAWSNNSTQEDLQNLAAGTYTVTVTDAAGCTATASATVLAIPFSIATHVGNATCAGFTDGEIDLIVTGGTAPYTYSWNDLPGTSVQDRVGLAPGTYTVTVSDNGVCTGTASATIGIAPPGPYLETFSTDGKGLLAGSTCPGMNASTCTNSNFAGVNWNLYGLDALLGIEPDDFFHTSGGKLEGKDFDQIICWESPLIDIAPPGAADAFSVELSWNGFDQEPPGPDPLDLVADHIDVEYSVDGGAWIRLPNQAGGGLTGHTVVYLNGAGSNLTGSATVSASGIDGSSLRIRVCGYLNADAETMSIDNVSAPSSKGLYCPLPGLSTTVTPTTCFDGNDGAIDLTVSGGTGPFTYLWSNNATTEDIAGLSSGMYMVTVTDLAGLTAVTMATVEEPLAIIIAQDLTNSQNITCFGGNDGALALQVDNAAEPLAYLWSNDETSSAIDSLASGSYSVTVTDANGCTGELQNLVLADPQPVQGILEPYDNPLCPGATTWLFPDTIFGGAGAPYSFALNGSVFPVAVGAGAHVARFSDRLGCSTSDTIIISAFVPSGAAIAGPDSACIFLPYTYALPGNFSNYLWTASGGGVVEQGQGTENISAHWATPGDKTLSVYFTDANGCPDTALLAVYVDVCLGARELALPGVRVLPNPFGEWLVVQFDRPVKKTAFAQLIDVQGRPLAGGSIGQENTRFNTSALPRGVYFLVIRENGQKGVWKVIKTD